jgi:hypothetical protein
MFPTDDSTPDGFITDLVAECKGNASEVLERCKDVLKKVVGSELSYEDSNDDWSVILPQWFIEACAKEISQEEAVRLIATPSGQVFLANRWTLKGFLYFFRSDDRSWYWWDGKVKDSDTLVVQLLVYGFPFAWEALAFLLKAAGADYVDELD